MADNRLKVRLAEADKQVEALSERLRKSLTKREQGLFEVEQRIEGLRRTSVPHRDPQSKIIENIQSRLDSIFVDIKKGTNADLKVAQERLKVLREMSSEALSKENEERVQRQFEVLQEQIRRETKPIKKATRGIGQGLAKHAGALTAGVALISSHNPALAALSSFVVDKIKEASERREAGRQEGIKEDLKILQEKRREREHIIERIEDVAPEELAGRETTAIPGTEAPEEEETGFKKLSKRDEERQAKIDLRDFFIAKGISAAKEENEKPLIVAESSRDFLEDPALTGGLNEADPRQYLFVPDDVVQDMKDIMEKMWEEMKERDEEEEKARDTSEETIRETEHDKERRHNELIATLRSLSADKSLIEQLKRDDEGILEKVGGIATSAAAVGGLGGRGLTGGLAGGSLKAKKLFPSPGDIAKATGRGGLTGAGTVSKALPEQAGRLGRMFGAGRKLIGKAFPALGLFLAGSEILQAREQAEETGLGERQVNRITAQQTGRVGASFAGGLAGAKLGAGLGSFLGPIGTAGGGILGGAGGAFLGPEIGEQFNLDEIMGDISDIFTDWFGIGKQGDITRVPKKTPELDISQLGQIAAKFESAGDVGAVAADAAGSFSYGAFQINTGVGAARASGGSMADFLEFAKEEDQSIANKLEAAGGWQAAQRKDPAFVEAWKEIAKNKPKKFYNLQHQYIAKSHYIPVINALKKRGIDLSKRPRAIQEIVWSIAVNSGVGGATGIIQKAVKESPKSLEGMTDEELLNSILDQKVSSLRRHGFENVARRFDIGERRAATEMLMSSGVAGPEYVATGGPSDIGPIKPVSETHLTGEALSKVSAENKASEKETMAPGGSIVNAPRNTNISSNTSNMIGNAPTRNSDSTHKRMNDQAYQGAV